MTLNDYQRGALATADYPQIRASGCGQIPIYPALGLAGEAGEFAEKVKKAWRNGNQLDVRAAGAELGDILWYVAVAAEELGLTLGEVAQMNLDKLADRQRRGVIKSEGDAR